MAGNDIRLERVSKVYPSEVRAVDAIEGAETGPGDRPMEPQVIERVELGD